VGDGPVQDIGPYLEDSTGIPLVPSGEVDLNPVMIFAILPAFAKPKEKVEEIFPLVSQLLDVVALSLVLFSTPMHGRRLACLCQKSVAKKSDHIRGWYDPLRVYIAAFKKIGRGKQ
jgi:hypothetical protein